MENDLSKHSILIGAEIFIEPGQKAAEIEGWFSVMSEHGMTLTRIRMFESYMHLKNGTWDFSLFDEAFRAGERYGVKIYANLFPETEFSDVGGFKFPKSKDNFAAIEAYIAQIVPHFSQFDSLYGWVPINEPGSGELPSDVFTEERFAEWKVNQTKPSYNSNGFTTLELAEQRFLLHYNTWFLEWLTQQIRQYDPVRPIHVNNHDIFRHASEYEFPRWRSFLSSLGGSAHASWHFDYFTRGQYAVAMSANAEILRSGAGEIPWLMTELQGGNNIYSGRIPMCPTKEEIIQWLWINIGSGSRGAIFWCLNPRRSGFEAGEWALLDFHDQPTDRFLAASSVTSSIARHQQLFEGATVADSGISILYTRESMWVEAALQIKGSSFAGREIGGVMKSALAYFEALSEMGIHANFKEISEFDFEQTDYSGKAIILAQQVSIPSRYWEGLKNFVAKGGRLIVDGLTGYYDENAYFNMGPEFPLSDLFGGKVKEFKMVEDLFSLAVKEPALELPAHLWIGSLLPVSGDAVGYYCGEAFGIRNSFGSGSVLWMPSMVGLACRNIANYSALVTLLSHELKDLMDKLPLRFKNHEPQLLMKVMKYGSELVSIIINKSTEKRTVPILVSGEGITEVLFAASAALNGQEITLDSEGTIVVKW